MKMQQFKMDFEELLSLILYYAEKHRIFSTQLQKTVFSFIHYFNFHLKEDLEFEADKFGPFSEIIMLNLNTYLASNSLKKGIERINSNIAVSYKFNEEIEKEIFRNVEINLIQSEKYPNFLIQFIKKFLEFYNFYRINNLIHMCYTFTPNMTIESKIRNKIIKMSHNILIRDIINLLNKIPSELSLIFCYNNKNKIISIYDFPEVIKLQFPIIIERIVKAVENKERLNSGSVLSEIEKINKLNLLWSDFKSVLIGLLILNSDKIWTPEIGVDLIILFLRLTSIINYKNYNFQNFEVQFIKKHKLKYELVEFLDEQLLDEIIDHNLMSSKEKQWDDLDSFILDEEIQYIPEEEEDEDIEIEFE